MTEQKITMLDYTQELLSNNPVFTPPTDDVANATDPYENATTVTVDMLRKRPDIRKATMEGLKDVIVPWTNDENEPEPVDYIDKQLIHFINMDPFIQATIHECLMEMADVVDEEGDEMYFPSIFDMTSAKDILRQQELGGFREDYDNVPAKYVHLSERHQIMIYTNPQARKILCKLQSNQITEKLVEQLCSKKT